ncbi:MAG: response regulator [Bdellovibrionaceae bacterium]|nr:response regulator [Pseudobdellovibrionaceae bacterium]
MKVLIVDDEDSVRRSLQRAFTVSGHEVRASSDGDEGLILWREFDPDLVVLDLIMPRKSGREVLKEIGQNRRAKVILISAWVGDYSSKWSDEVSADLFLPKPFSDIFAVVQAAEGLVS